MQASLEHGAFRGQPIDVRTRRSLSLVDESSDAFLVDHFFHDGRFFAARIPRRGVVRIHGQTLNFGGGRGWLGGLLNHAQARFVLGAGYCVELLAAVRADAPVVGRVADFCYSVEAVGPPGVAWSLRHAFGDLIAAHRFLSTSEVVFERVVRGGFVVRQSPPLRLTADQMQRGLELLVRRSAAAGLRQRYYLLTARGSARNCTSSVFDALDRVRAEEYTPFQRLASRLLWRLPLHLRRYLDVRAAIDPAATMPPLEDELAELVASAAMQARLPRPVAR